MRKYLNIFIPECHYVWIKGFRRVISHVYSDKKKAVFVCGKLWVQKGQESIFKDIFVDILGKRIICRSYVNTLNPINIWYNLI
jgi:hypothetical protein